MTVLGSIRTKLSENYGVQIFRPLLHFLGAPIFRLVIFQEISWNQEIVKSVYIIITLNSHLPVFRKFPEILNRDKQKIKMHHMLWEGSNKPFKFRYQCIDNKIHDIFASSASICMSGPPPTQYITPYILLQRTEKSCGRFFS